MDCVCDLCWQYSLRSTTTSQTSTHWSDVSGQFLPLKSHPPPPPHQPTTPVLRLTASIRPLTPVELLTLVFLEQRRSGSGAEGLLRRYITNKNTLFKKKKFLTHTNLQTETGLLCVCVCWGVSEGLLQWKTLPKVLQVLFLWTKASTLQLCWCVKKKKKSLRGGIHLRPPPHPTICNM